MMLKDFQLIKFSVNAFKVKISNISDAELRTTYDTMQYSIFREDRYARGRKC